jgi:hypothetical protein
MLSFCADDGNQTGGTILVPISKRSCLGLIWFSFNSCCGPDSLSLLKDRKASQGMSMASDDNLVQGHGFL